MVILTCIKEIYALWIFININIFVGVIAVKFYSNIFAAFSTVDIDASRKYYPEIMQSHYVPDQGNIIHVFELAHRFWGVLLSCWLWYF